MKIGLDIDGVILDYESILRAKAEIYDVMELKGNGIINKDEMYFQNLYEWGEETEKTFIDKYFEKLSYDVPLMPCVKEVLEYFKDNGHETVIISARGASIPNMIKLAQNIFEKNNLIFDKYIWRQVDKLDACNNQNIDIMIDDNPQICEKLAKNNIRTIYFKSVATKDLEENHNLKVVTNWGEILRYIRKMEEKNEQKN